MFESYKLTFWSTSSMSKTFLKNESIISMTD